MDGQTDGPSRWVSKYCAINSLAHLKEILEKKFFKLIWVIGGWGIFCEIALRWMPLDLTDDKSTLVQVMAWCRQATSHYLSQCWPRSLSPYDVTRPQWVNRVYQPGDNYWDNYLGALYLQVTATHLRIGLPQIWSKGAQSSTQWQRLTVTIWWCTKIVALQ